MAAVPPFPEGQIDSLARFLGECGTGTDISRVFADRKLVDRSGESTKWRRLYSVFSDIQRRDRSANRILDFIQSYLSPARFVGRGDEFEEIREGLNARLSFAGLEYGADGQFRQREAARTLDEAEARVRTIQSIQDSAGVPVVRTFRDSASRLVPGRADSGRTFDMRRDTVLAMALRSFSIRRDSTALPPASIPPGCFSSSVSERRGERTAGAPSPVRNSKPESRSSPTSTATARTSVWSWPASQRTRSASPTRSRQTTPATSRKRRLRRVTAVDSRKARARCLAASSSPGRAAI